MTTKDCVQHIFLNRADKEFPVPSLKTEAGKLSYTIGVDPLYDSEGNEIDLEQYDVPVSARRIKTVFIKSPNAIPNWNFTSFTGEEFIWSGVNSYWSRVLARSAFYRVPVIVNDSNGANECSITFVEDPGDSENRYFVEFYFDQPEIESDYTKIFINTDKWQQAIIDGTVGFIEDAEDGISKRLEKFYSYWVPRYIRDTNMVADQRRPLQIQCRECG